uniref:Uncharacterized protein n=2 Tax=unclassified Caudoviricetes TaxID=2788787 RepID=A0A8S5QU61_9CAUD|nr:MAG TPA: hypothetical protein [Caudovirales sp. ctmZz45]DAF89076.1 MAG TPA: hypothetical protein [Caudovirales sp. ctMof18]DAK23990.1 MAG TPA: hypothetical protein [Caudoviricetes sp.]DAX65749.1 MAG TPA: hypothetical protein [Caudoviricetes sp.]
MVSCAYWILTNERHSPSNQRIRSMRHIWQRLF